MMSTQLDERTPCHGTTAVIGNDGQETQRPRREFDHSPTSAADFRQAQINPDEFTAPSRLTARLLRGTRESCRGVTVPSDIVSMSRFAGSDPVRL